MFDFSNYPQNHKLFNNKNKSKLGFFKDETMGTPIREFCCLRPKMYSYIFENKNKKTSKGTKHSITIYINQFYSNLNY